jgi:RNA polymerase primary sigma factor
MTVSELQIKQAIEQALRSFSTGYLATNALALFQALGYQSDKNRDFDLRTPANFIIKVDRDSKLNQKTALFNEWLFVDFLFQLTWDKIISNSKLQLPPNTSAKTNNTFFISYLFFVIELKGSSYTIGQLDGIVYEINKLFPMPVIVLFRHGVTLTLSIIDRRPHKRNEFKDVFEKVKHIKDIPFASPTHTQIKKLFDLSLVKLHQKHDFSNFDEFHEALQKTLDGNVKFLKEAIPEDSTRLYLQEIGRIPLLRPSEEIELARKIADLLKLERIRERLESELERTPHDAEWADAVQMPLSDFRHRLEMGRKAKKQMVESNLRLVVSIAKKYQNRGLEFLDLIQEGNLGLIRATEKFDPEKGNRFSTCAYWWIQQEITRAIANQSRTIRLPVHLYQTISQIKKTTKLLWQEVGRNPTASEIADRRQMTINDLRDINQYAQPVISLDIQVGEEDSTLGDLIEFNGETPEEQVSKAILRENLESVLDTLSPREQDVLRLRYGFDDGQEKNLQKIGDLFNLSRERIRQIKVTALDKLRSRKHRTFLEVNIPPQVFKAAQTKNVTCPKNRQTEVKPLEILHHHHFEKNSEESNCSTRAAPAQTVDLIASQPSKQTANLEEENTTQAELLSFDLSENNRNQANRQEANQTLAELKETDLNGVATKPMQQNSADLHQQVTSLENTFSQLVPKLSKALQELQDLGKPLSAELILELSNSRNQFNALRARVFELAEFLVLSPTQKEPEIDSLTGLKSLLQDAVQAEEQKEAITQVRQQALRVLERVLGIAHRDNSNFQPLLECQEKARELQRAISESQEPDSHSDTQALAEGNHSFAQLLTLIEQGDELDDDRSADLHDSVAESFGRTLATAAVRGRLIVQEESVPNFPSVSIIKESKVPTRAQPPEPETAPSVEHPVVDKSDVAQAESEMSNGKLLPCGNGFAERAYTPSNIKVIPDSQPVEKLIATAQTVTPLPSKIETHKDEPESESEQTEEDIQPQYQLTLNDIDQQNTASVSGDISEEHPLALHEQIWQLLYENQLSLAFHLARCLESKYPNFQPHLPSGIIRGVILGRHVRYDVGVGEIANSLRNGFTNLSNNCFLDGESEWNQAVSLLSQDVLKELDSFDVKNSSVLVKAGISCCRIAVEDIRILFEPNELLPTVEPEEKYLLNAELLKIPSLPMNSDWQPEDGSQDLFVKELFNLVTQPHYDWQQAFDMRINSRDHEATGRIIEYLQANWETSIDIAQLEQQRNHQIDNCRAELEIAVKETRRKLEGDVALGLLGESERLDYAAQIESLENAIATTLRFSDKFEQLRAIGEAINTNRSQKIDEVRQKLLQEIGSEHPAYTRIGRVLDTGDVLTANEYVDMVQRGQSIPEPEKRRDAFIDFFKKYAALEDVLEPADRNRPKRRELINDISKGRNIGSLHMQKVPGAQARQASEMLEAWFTAKNNKETITQDNARKILRNLGFNTAQLTINQVGDYTRIDVNTEPIQDRNRCPIPAYGSEAKGHYRILCVWNRPSEEDLLNAVGDTSQDSGAIVFHFGRMTARRRTDIGTKSQIKLILLDVYKRAVAIARKMVQLSLLFPLNAIGVKLGLMRRFKKLRD